MKNLSDVYLDDGLRGYIYNIARKELWRIQKYYELDDLIQDGYLCYYKCVKAYPNLLVDEPTKDQRKHFMSLVKTTYANHIIDLANKRTFVREVVLSDLAVTGSFEDSSEASIWDTFISSPPEASSVALMFAMAPMEIKELVKLLVSDSKQLLEFRRVKKHRRALRETTNEFYCRLLGLDPSKEDVVGRVRSYFSMGY